MLVSGLALKNELFQFNLTYSFPKTRCVYRTCRELRACLQYRRQHVEELRGKWTIQGKIRLLQGTKHYMGLVSFKTK